MEIKADHLNHGDFAFRIEGYSSLLKNKNTPDSGDVSNFAKEIASALNNLPELDNSSKLREDAIRNGKAIIKNWSPPTNEQIDKILFNMQKELLA